MVHVPMGRFARAEEIANAARQTTRSQGVTPSATGGGDGCTPSKRAGRSGSHQFQRPNSDTTAGTSSARITVASSMIPAASAVANTFTSVSGADDIDTNAKNRISAALVTSRPVRPTPRTTAASVEPDKFETGPWTLGADVDDAVA